MRKFVLLCSHNIKGERIVDSVRKECFLNGEELYQSIVGNGTSDVHVLVGQLLIGLGFKSKLIGTQLLKDAILYRYEKYGVAHVNYSMEIYSYIAEQQNSTPGSVERAIRHAINDCAKFGNLAAFGDLLHSRITIPGYVPSNTELISLIVDWLDLERAKGHITVERQIQ